MKLAPEREKQFRDHGDSDCWELLAEIDELRAELKTQDHANDAYERQNAELVKERNYLRETLKLIAAGRRPDGTFNRCREACEKLAKKALAQVKKDP